MLIIFGIYGLGIQSANGTAHTMMLSALCLKCVIVMGLGPLPLTLVLIVPLIVLLVVLWTTSSSFF